MPNYGKPGQRPSKLRPGLVLAIEPMVNVGGRARGPAWIRMAGRPVRKDGSLSAHFEYSVAVTPTGVRILGTTQA